jgi:hypothetical protein
MPEPAPGAAAPPSTAQPPPVPQGVNIPPWHGGLLVGFPFLAAAWLITYTLLPVPGQESLGGWNYLVGAGLFLVPVVLGPVLRARVERARARLAARPPERPAPAG